MHEIDGRATERRLGPSGPWPEYQNPSRPHRDTQVPIRNLSDSLNARLQGLSESVAAGEVDIARNQAEILD